MWLCEYTPVKIQTLQTDRDTRISTYLSLSSIYLEKKNWTPPLSPTLNFILLLKGLVGIPPGVFFLLFFMSPYDHMFWRSFYQHLRSPCILKCYLVTQCGHSIIYLDNLSAGYLLCFNPLLSQMILQWMSLDMHFYENVQVFLWHRYSSVSGYAYTANLSSK